MFKSQQDHSGPSMLKMRDTVALKELNLQAAEIWEFGLEGYSMSLWALDALNLGFLGRNCFPKLALNEAINEQCCLLESSSVFPPQYPIFLPRRNISKHSECSVQHLDKPCGVSSGD